MPNDRRTSSRCDTVQVRWRSAAEDAAEFVPGREGWELQRWQGAGVACHPDSCGLEPAAVFLPSAVLATAAARLSTATATVTCSNLDGLWARDATLATLVDVVAGTRQPRGQSLWREAGQTAIAIHVLARYSAKAACADVEAISDDCVAVAIAHLRSNLDRTVSLRELAHVTHVSEGSLHRSFTRRLGNTPARYGRQLRLDEARRRVAESPDSIADIAAQCGFASAAHLAASFRQRFGESPSAHRRQNECRWSAPASAKINRRRTA